MPDLSKYANIPEELKRLKQWVLWRSVDIGGKKPTKVPYTPWGTKASVIKASDWCSFEDALHTLENGNSNADNSYDGLGFVFTIDDPYSFIDLDYTEDRTELARHQLIYSNFVSYSEHSPSNTGLHIIVRGALPRGRRRSNVEIYSSERYATMTGNVQRAMPIADYNDQLNALFAQMGSAPELYKGSDINEPERLSDNDVLTTAYGAVNGTKFADLFKGDWQSYYPSQSEADFALIDIIAFYTQNRAQITRLFHSSNLGKRDKAQRKDYIAGMISRSFDRRLPMIDIDGYNIQLEMELNQNATNSGSGVNSSDIGDSVGQSLASPIGATSSGSSHDSASSSVAAYPVVGADTFDIEPPPGLVGEIARFIYAAAPRPAPEMAIAGALAFMAGVCGRAYNVSGTGLNIYMLLLAVTGTGKEGMASGIDKIINALQTMVPTANEFLGPAEIASGQALIRFLTTKSNSFVSILGEFGYRLETMTADNATSSERTLKRMLMDLYNKSGNGQQVRASIYADSDKNTGMMTAPAISLLAESTPETFYRVLSEEMIADGFLPRFNIIEYKGRREHLNTNGIGLQPPYTMIDQIANVMANAKTIMGNLRVCDVMMSDEASRYLHDFDRQCDAKINNAEGEVTRQLWNRAHVKVLKLSALIAVGVNYLMPTIELAHVLWAIKLVENDIKTLMHKFSIGLVGNSGNERNQLSEVKKKIELFLNDPWEKISPYIGDQRYHSHKIIPYAYLSRRLISMAAFRKDRAGATIAIKRAIQTMTDIGALQEVPKQQLRDKLGSEQKAYIVVKFGALDEI